MLTLSRKVDECKPLRTGLNPVVSFPLLRSPYPKYIQDEAGWV
jgi:hypothetical protein